MSRKLILTRQYCETHGISLQQLLSTPESLANVAYSRWLIDTGLRGDSLDLQVATTPCLIGYGLIGARLLVATEGVDKSEQNPYWSWIAQYGNPKFQAAVQTGTGTTDRMLFGERSKYQVPRRYTRDSCFGFVAVGS